MKLSFKQHSNSKSKGPWLDQTVLIIDLAKERSWQNMFLCLRVSFVWKWGGVILSVGWKEEIVFARSPLLALVIR